jgi:hypothetical protein
MDVKPPKKAFFGYWVVFAPCELKTCPVNFVFLWATILLAAFLAANLNLRWKY